MEERLLQLRKSVHKTQTELAQYLGIAQNSYKNYEKGEAEPNIDRLIKLADYYHVTIDYLVGRQFASDVGYLTEQEQELLNVIKTLSSIDQSKVLAFALGIASK